MTATLAAADEDVLLWDALKLGAEELPTAMLKADVLDALLLDAIVLTLGGALDAALLELKTTLEEDNLALELEGVVLELDTRLEDEDLVLEPTELELEILLEITDELETMGAEELELAFVDDIELLDAFADEELGPTVDEEDEELED